MFKPVIPRLLLLAGLIASLPAIAETAIPDTIKQHILQRHPQATELQASEASHFGNKLLKLSYKDGEDINLELFHANGKLFSNVLPIDDPAPLPGELLKTLKTEFPDYQFKQGEMVVNPNGVGEEYSLHLLVNNSNWLVQINSKGKILGKSNF